MKKLIIDHLNNAKSALEVFSENEIQIELIEKAAVLMSICLRTGGKIITCGNGGSMSDAMHFTNELMGKYRNERPPLASVCISDPGYITCVGNDFGFDEVFKRSIQGIAQPGDVVLFITTSGKSQNIISSLNVPKGVKSVLLTSLKCPESADSKADITIKAPYSRFADHIQEIHIKILHILVLLIEKQLFQGRL